MDLSSQSKITQNLVCMKSTLSHLDPVIDRLIEDGIFNLADRNRIESVSESWKQFNIFIGILIASPDPNAYKTFRKALKLEGYVVVADKLDQTTPRIPRSASSRQSRTRDRMTANHNEASSDAVGASGSSSPGNRRPDSITGESTVINAIERLGKNQQDFMADIKRLREEDLARREEERKHDRDVLQKQFDSLKNNIFDEQDTIGITRRYVSLQEKYEHLKKVQEGMRSVDKERVERLKTVNRENINLTTKHEKLQKAYSELEMKMIRMETLLSNQEIEKSVNESNIPEENTSTIDKLLAEKRDLMEQLEEKVATIESLQEQLDEQKDLKGRRQSEQENVRLTIGTDREEKFDKLYEMVETMAKERSIAVDDTPRPEQKQKPNPALRAKRMQLKERERGPNRLQGPRPSKVQLGLDC